MTVKECYDRAVAFLPEDASENTELQQHMVLWCNMLLAECLGAENAFRKSKGQAELSEAPLVYATGDTIPYNARLVAAAFPYGMARWIFRDNDEIDESRAYNSYYAVAIEENTPAAVSEISDYYA